MIACLLLIVPPAAVESETPVLVENWVYQVDEKESRLLFRQFGGVDLEGRWHWWRFIKQPHIDHQRRLLTFTDRGTLRVVRFHTYQFIRSDFDLELEDRAGQEILRRELPEGEASRR